MADGLPPLVVFADDWGRHPSSCQHLIRRLLPSDAPASGAPVTWVNTIGMRSPRLDLSTLKRGLEKLRHWSRKGEPPAEVPRGLRVVNPRMWPSFRSRFGRRLNRRLLVRQLTPLCESLPEPPVAVTTLPIVADLVGQLPVRSWVYYCVDDFGQWPGLDQEVLRRMDDELIDRADVLVAVSETLRDRIRRRDRDAHLLTHGVDLDFWRGGSQAGSVEGLDRFERPLVVFFGVIDRRMDVSFVQRLGAGLGRGTVLLVGPQADPDPALWRLPRVAHLPPLPFAQLPALTREAAVLVMPYADLPVTRAIQPLKLKEYLAAGRPVVVRDLPATRDWADCLDVAADADSFARLVRERLDGRVPPAQAVARGRLRDEGWEEKARAFARWALGGALAGAQG